MKKKIIITVLSIVCILCIAVAGITVYHAEKVKGFEPNSQEAIDYFADRSASGLIKDIKYFSDIEEMNLDLISALDGKITQDDAALCAKAIKSDRYPTAAKIALLDLCTNKDIALDNKTMSKMITDKSLDSELRPYIIGYCSEQDNDYIEEIKSVASDSNDEFNYLALNRLSGMNKSAAEEIAKQVIAEYNGTFSDRMKSALIIEAERVGGTGDDKEIDDFTNYCNKISSETDDSECRYSVSVALDAMKSAQPKVDQ